MDNTIDKLQIIIEAEAENASKGLDRFIASMEKIKNLNTADNSGLQRINETFKELSRALKKVHDLPNKLAEIKNALGNFGTVDISGVSGLVEQFKQLDGLSDMTEFSKGVNTMSNAFTKMENLDINRVTQQIKDLVLALKPLTDEMIRGGERVGTYGQQMLAFVTAAKQAAAAQVSYAKTEKMTKTGTGGGVFGGIFSTLKNIKSSALFAFVVRGVKEISKVVAKSVATVSDYVEAMNLFNVSMGSFSETAGMFVEEMESKLGANATEVSKNIGTFMSLAKSFGVAGDQAYLMSKNLTQLAYDYSSFFNISIEDAYQKLRSGFVGEIEPMRAIGKDLSVARLQQELYNMGINASVESLTQADKATLRYIVTMKQSGDQMNDLARTIESPANMVRMLNSQFQILARTIGSIFLPALSAILPYAIAVVKVLTQVAQAIANFFGATIPEFGASDKNFENVTDGLGGIGDAAQQANKDVLTLIGGFDELNKINVPQADMSGIGGGNILDGIELPEYDIFDKLIESKVDQIVIRIKEAFEGLAQTLRNMGIDEVINDFQRFGEEIMSQIESYDFGGALTNAMLAGVDLAISTVNLSNKLTLPLVIALDVPGIVYETIGLVESALSSLDSIIESITPGMERFVEIGLVPIAEWLGNRIREALRWVSKKFEQLGQWFTDNESKFTKFGEGLGVITDWLWGLISPLNDVAWEAFKRKVEKIAEKFESWLTLTLNIVAGISDLITKAEELKDEMDKSGAFIKRYADDFYGLYEAVKGVGDMLSGVFKILIGAYYEDWETLWDGMGDIAVGGGETITGVVRQTFGYDAAKPIESWYETAKSYFEKPKWEGLGYNIVQGLNGGLGHISGVGVWFGTLITIAKNIFGIHSPSTEFEKIGVWIVEGLAKGVAQWSSVVKMFETGLAKLKTTFTASWTLINSKTEEFFSRFVSTVESSMQNVYQTTQQRMQELSAFWQQTWENLRKLTSTLLDQIRTTANQAFSNIKSMASSFISTVRTEWTNGWNAIKSSTSSVFSSIKSAASSAFSSISSAVSSVISKIKNAISSLKDLISWRDKADDLDFDDVNDTGLKGIAALRASRGITTFASGGVVDEPTYALVGEYSSAKSNPEIIAPQNVIEQSVVNANGDMVGALYDMAVMIVSAIESNSVTIEGDADAMFKAVRKRGVEYQRNTGKPVFTP